MSVIGGIFKREINGVLRDVEAVTAFMGIMQNPVNGFWYAIDWNHKNRAAFETPETARKWCRAANKAYAGLPSTNAEIAAFNEAMTMRGWRVSRLLGDCQVWSLPKPLFDAGGLFTREGIDDKAEREHNEYWGNE